MENSIIKNTALTIEQYNQKYLIMSHSDLLESRLNDLNEMKMEISFIRRMET